MTTEETSPAVGAGTLDSLRDMFKTMVPTGQVVIVDALGVKHEIRPLLNARTQIVMLSEFEELFEKNAAMRAAARSLGSSETSEIVKGLIVASRDPEVQHAIGLSFKTAYPDTLAKAGVGITDAGHDINPSDPFEVFAIEELISAITPFFGSLLDRVVAAMMSLQDLTAVQEAMASSTP